MPRQKYDIEKMENLYRLGQLTVREIGEQCKCSHCTVVKYAKRYGWVRDKHREVIRKTREALTRESDVEVHVKKNLEIIKSHKDILSEKKKIAFSLINELKENQPFTALDKDGNKIELHLTLTEKAKIFNLLSQAIKTWIDIERQTYNIDSITQTRSHEDEFTLRDDEAEEMRIVIKELLIKKYKRLGK